MSNTRMKASTPRPLVVVMSAPSGAGKSTLCDRLLAEFPQLSYSISCTTRAPRGAELDGVDYHFLSVDEFLRRIDQGDFLEHADVHGNHYGTLRETVRQGLSAGRSVLMDIDVVGAGQIRENVALLPADNPLRAGFLDIFVEPPSMQELRRRLKGRGEDAAEVIDKRMANAAGEMARKHEFAYRVVNDDLERAYAQLRGILVDAWGRDALT